MPTSAVALDGRVALVTGASSGLGRSFALTLARAGAKVAAGARRLDRLDALVAAIEAFGGRALALPLDVTDAESVAEAVARAETELGALDTLVNNAGIATTRSLLETPEAEWDAVLDTDLKGAFLMARAVARQMVTDGRAGVIVNVASILAERPAKGLAAYAAAKAGLVQLTRVLALELARHRIRVNALAPGYVVTEMNREFLAGPGGERIRGHIPLGRFAEPADLDGALLFLVSDAARYATGTVVTLDGGFSLA